MKQVVIVGKNGPRGVMVRLPAAWLRRTDRKDVNVGDKLETIVERDQITFRIIDDPEELS